MGDSIVGNLKSALSTYYLYKFIILLVTGKLLDTPLKSIVLRDIVSMTCGRIEAGALYILWDWHVDIDVICDASFLVVAFDLDNEPDSSIGRSLHDHVY